MTTETMDSPAEDVTDGLTDKRGFGNLPPQTLKALKAIQSKTFYPRGSIIFAEGQSPSGIFLVLSGEAKLSATDRQGKTRILRIVGPGGILGLSAAVSGDPHDATAEANLPTHAIFIGRNEFVGFLQDHPEAALRVVELLSNDLDAAYEKLRSARRSPSRAGPCAPGTFRPT